MNDSDAPASINPQEIAFLQQYIAEQLHFLGHPDHSPATNWLQEQGLTNLDAGRFVLALAERNIKVSLMRQEPKAEFQSPWRNRDEFLSRLEQLTNT